MAEIDAFIDALINAASARGSILPVAQLLEVDPLQVYMWIAGEEIPPEQERARVLEKLANAAPPPV